MKVALFHHIYLVNNWREIVDEQLAITANWPIKFDYFPNVVEPGQEPLYEIGTLDKLHAWAIKNPNSVAFYIHTKGVTNPASQQSRKWRETLNYWVLYRYRLALRTLIEGDLDAVGSRYFDMKFRTGNLPHFSGNFWLAKTNYIATLKQPSRYVTTYKPKFGTPPERYGCEFWIGSGKGKLADIHHSFKVNLSNFNKSFFDFKYLIAKFGKDN